MSQQTTRQETRIFLLYGWLSSIALHALMLLSMFPLFRQSLIAIHKEPFHWDVALVQTIPTAHESIEPVDVAKSAISKQPDRTPTVSQANRTIRQAAPSAEHSTSLIPKTQAPVIPKTRPNSLLPATSSKKTAVTSIPDELSPTLAQTTELLSQQSETTIDSTTQAPPRSETATASATLEENTPPTDTTQPSPAPTTSIRHRRSFLDTPRLRLASASNFPPAGGTQAVFSSSTR